MHQAGGRISVNIGGKRFAPRGKASIKPAQLSHEVNVNHDGSVSRSTKPMAATADLTFDRGANGFKWDKGFMLPFVDVTIAETDVGVMHVFTGATIVGEPEIDTETGEVTGLSIATDQYTQTKI
jgi:hypothetical protein